MFSEDQRLNIKVPEMIYPYTDDQLRKDNPQVSFPSSIDHSLRLSFGVHTVIEVEQPDGDVVTEGDPEFVDGEWRQTWVVSEFSADQNRDRVAARRYQEETKGTTINGIPVHTDRQSQALITGAALAATIDPAYVCQWKTSDGFITLDAAAIIGVATAVRNHVQACFNREAELIAAIEDETYTSDMLNEGWSAWQS